MEFNLENNVQPLNYESDEFKALKPWKRTKLLALLSWSLVTTTRCESIKGRRVSSSMVIRDPACQDVRTFSHTGTRGLPQVVPGYGQVLLSQLDSTVGL